MRRRARAMAVAAAVTAVAVGSGTAGAQDGTPSTTASPTASSSSSTTSPSTSSTVPPTTSPPTTTTPPTTATPPAAAPAAAPKARGVGDSVFYSARTRVTNELKPEYRPWFVAGLGASINEMQDTAEHMVTKSPAVFVIGMGNPDVEIMDDPVYGFVPYLWAADMLDATASVPCVLWVNLKERGVNPYYSPHWTRETREFNAWLRQQANARANFHVIDWNAAAAQHPRWFLADGLHLNNTGKVGYARKIDRVVNRVCAG